MFRLALATIVLLATILVPPPPAPARGPVLVAVLPDLQNYVTTIDPPLPPDPNDNTALRQQMLSGMVADIIARHVTFAVQVGDMTDSTGGPDQMTTGDVADDPNTQGLPMDTEWQREHDLVAVPLAAAGVPFDYTLGNHDSSVGAEHWFPSSGWHATNQRPCGTQGGSCGLDRSLVVATPLGPWCVLTSSFVVPAAAQQWLAGQVGCGASMPTVLVHHSDPTSMLPPSYSSPLIVLEANGHWVPAPGPTTYLQSWSVSGGHLQLFTNFQEMRPGGPGADRHTGLGWWTLVTFQPDGTVTVEAESAYLGGRHDSDDPQSYIIQNGSGSLPTLCPRLGC